MDIKANGSDSSISITSNETLSISISLDAGTIVNTEADYWVVKNTPSGWFYLDSSVFDFDYPQIAQTDLTGTHSNQMMDKPDQAQPMEILPRLPHMSVLDLVGLWKIRV